MLNKKKLLIEFKFIEQQLNELILQNNLPLFDLLEDKEDVIGRDNSKGLRNSFTKNIKQGEHSVKHQMVRVSKLAYKLEKLHKWQMKRRRVFFDKIKEYLTLLEAREEQDFKDKYCFEQDEFCLANFFNHSFEESKDFKLDEEAKIDVISEDAIEDEVEIEETEEAENEEILSSTTEEKKPEKEEKPNIASGQIGLELDSFFNGKSTLEELKA